METKQRFITMFIALVAMFMGTQVKADEAYAVLSDNGKTLTFYYDMNKSTFGDTAYDLNTADNKPGWYIPFEWNEENPNKIEKVKFTSDFKRARPTSTYKWFSDQEKLTLIDGINYLNTSEVLNMEKMFYQCSSLTNLDVSGFNTKKVKTMYAMFGRCENLTGLDLKNFDTSNVTNMSVMFYACKSLTTLDLCSFNTSKVEYMGSMFGLCEQLTSLDLSSFDTSHVLRMADMFTDCSRLKTINVSSFNTSKVETMANMFSHCEQLTDVDLSGFDTSSVIFIRGMFTDCKQLTSLNLTSFDTSNVEQMAYLFNNCTMLETIYVSSLWNTEKVTQSEYMFLGCTNLKGEKGTSYNYGITDKEYARIDYGKTAPGYLSSDANLTYKLEVAGTAVTGSNKDDILDNGVFSYTPATKTLAIKGDYTNNSNNDIIRSNTYGLTIDVTQDAILKEASYNYSGCPIWLDAPATIKGAGKLTLKGSKSNAGLYLFSGASVTIDHMNMDVEGMWGISGPWEEHYNNEKLIVKSSNIIISTPENEKDSGAILDLSGGIELRGCSITSPSGAYINGVAVYDSNDKVAKSVTITADEGISTDIEQVTSNKYQVTSDDWYTIDGRKLSGKPNAKGVYIHKGKKVVVN